MLQFHYLFMVLYLGDSDITILLESFRSEIKVESRRITCKALTGFLF